MKNFIKFILFLPAALVFLIWYFSKNTVPALDSACFFEASVHLADSFYTNGIEGFLSALSSTPKALLNSIAGAFLIFIFGVEYTVISGVLNSALVLILTLGLFRFLRKYYDESRSLLNTFVILTLPWVVYITCLNESQLAQIAFSICFLAYLPANDEKPTKWNSVLLGFFAGLAVVSRPFESLIFLGVFLLFFAAKFRKETRALLLLGLGAFLVTAGPWAYVSRDWLLAWILRNSSDQLLGAFYIRAPGVYGYFASLFLEFAGLSFLVLVSPVIFFRSLKPGELQLWLKANRVILSYFLVASIFVPVLIFLFIGAKNPGYFYLNYIFFYLMFMLLLRPVFLKKNKTSLALLGLIIFSNVIFNLLSYRGIITNGAYVEIPIVNIKLVTLPQFPDTAPIPVECTVCCPREGREIYKFKPLFEI